MKKIFAYTLLTMVGVGTLNAADYVYFWTQPGIIDVLTAPRPPQLIFSLQLRQNTALSEIQYDLLQILKQQISDVKLTKTPSPEIALSVYMLVPNQALLDFLRVNAVENDFTVKEWLALLTLENGNVTPVLQDSFAMHIQNWQDQLPARIIHWMYANSQADSARLLQFLKTQYPDVFAKTLEAMDTKKTKDATIDQCLEQFYQRVVLSYNSSERQELLPDKEHFAVGDLGSFLNPANNPLAFFQADPTLLEKYEEEYETSADRYLVLKAQYLRKLDWLPPEVTTYIADEYAKLALKFADQEKALADAEAAYIAQYPDRASKPVDKSLRLKSSRKLN